MCHRSCRRRSGSTRLVRGRKTDATDAHSVALAGTRMTGLRPLVADADLDVLRLLADRRRSLGEEHTRKVSQAPLAPAFVNGSDLVVHLSKNRKRNNEPQV